MEYSNRRMVSQTRAAWTTHYLSDRLLATSAVPVCGGRAMRGLLLSYSTETRSGIISGDDGQRYSFRESDWNDSRGPENGLRVDFEAVSDTATAIYVDPSSPAVTSGSGYQGVPRRKSKVAAGLLAIFLGGFGIHKFYLGYIGAGFIHIVLTFIIIGIPVNWVITIIEAIIYFTKSDEDFYQTYEVGRRNFF